MYLHWQIYVDAESYIDDYFFADKVVLVLSKITKVILII